MLYFLIICALIIHFCVNCLGWHEASDEEKAIADAAIDNESFKDINKINNKKMRKI